MSLSEVKITNCSGAVVISYAAEFERVSKKVNRILKLKKPQRILKFAAAG
jgi:hypothetical protein